MRFYCFFLIAYFSHSTLLAFNTNEHAADAEQNCRTLLGTIMDAPEAELELSRIRENGELPAIQSLLRVWAFNLNQEHQSGDSASRRSSRTILADCKLIACSMGLGSFAGVFLQSLLCTNVFLYEKLFVPIVLDAFGGKGSFRFLESEDMMPGLDDRCAIDYFPFFYMGGVILGASLATFAVLKIRGEGIVVEEIRGIEDIILEIENIHQHLSGDTKELLRKIYNKNFSQSPVLTV